MKHCEFDVDYFENIDSSNKAYWFGFLLADGCVRKYCCTLALNDKDVLHLQKLKICLNGNMDIKFRKNRSSCSITMHSKKFVEDLSKLGCVKNKTKYGFLNFEPFKQYKYDFLRGYIDGNGSIDKKRYRIIITIPTYEIANEIVKNFKEYYPILKNHETYYVVSFERRKTYFDFWNKLYKNAEMFLDRKKLLYENRINALQGQMLMKSLGIERGKKLEG